MKSQFLIPGMIFSLVDRRPVASTAAGTLPMHFYLVISVGSTACLQDIQCMSISSMRNKDITYELPVVVNETVSYVVPYNIVSFRRDDVKIEYYRGFLVGHPDLMPTDEFLKLCRDIYTDTLYGEIDNSIKDRVVKYQKTFATVYKDTPRYEGNKTFVASTAIPKAKVEESSDLPVYSVDPAESQTMSGDDFKKTLERIDNLPHSYTQWSNDAVFTALLFFSDNDLINIVAMSNRYKSIGTLDNVKRTLRKIIKGMSTPVYTTIINGHSYSINFITTNCEDRIAPADMPQFLALQSRIKKAMR